jgi:MerR family transcriptional regulator, heat shock protein HspR
MSEELKVDRDQEPVYTMAVAARLTRMHPQTLRKYERAGLLRPARSGAQRFYSDADIRRLERIRYLVEERGLNVAGLDMALSMADRLDEVHAGSTSDEMRTAVADTLRMTTDSRES